VTHPETSSESATDSTTDAAKVVDTGAHGGRPSDFGELAKKIRSRATDIIVIGIVVAAGLSLAGRVTEWWRKDPEVITASPDILPPAPWESTDGLALQFGDQPWAMHRRQMTGDEQAVTAAMKNSCIAILEKFKPRDSLPNPDAAELRLLESLKSFAPSESVAGEWGVYELGGFLPWVVGVRESIPGDDPDAEQSRRLLCWTMALPQPDGSWVVHTIDRQGGASGIGGSDFNLPLPQGARPSLRLSDERGGSLICLSGPGPVAEWSRELNVAWHAAGWWIVREWTTSGNTRSAVFSQATDDGRHHTAEVVLSDTGPAEAVGTIIITAESVQADETSEAP
jgi:hypothetical protein